MTIGHSYTFDPTDTLSGDATITATDRADNQTQATVTLNAYRTDPDITLNVMPDGLFLQIAWSITDTVVGLRDCTLEIQPPDGAWTPLSTDCAGSMAYPGTQDETYPVRVIGVNGVGNPFDETTSVTLSSVTKYYHSGGSRVAMSKGDTVYFLHGDHLGSTSLTTDRDAPPSTKHAICRSAAVAGRAVVR